MVNLAESEEAVGDKENLPPIWRWNHLNVTDVISEGARDCDVTHCFHLGQRVEQSLILPVLECCGQNLFVCRSGVLINGQRYRKFLSQLRLCAPGSGVDRFWLRSVLGKG